MDVNALQLSKQVNHRVSLSRISHPFKLKNDVSLMNALFNSRRGTFLNVTI